MILLPKLGPFLLLLLFYDIIIELESKKAEKKLKKVFKTKSKTRKG